MKTQTNTQNIAFNFSDLLTVIDTLSKQGQNLSFRTISTGALASWTNRTINEVIGESVRMNNTAVLQTAALQGCTSLKLIEELEKAEAFEVKVVPLATLQTDKAMGLHLKASALAKETGAIGNRYEQPMTMAQWLKYLVVNTQKDNAAGLIEFAEVSGHDLKDIQYMDSQARKMELERLDKAIPALIDQYKIDAVQLKDAEDVSLDIFNYFKLMLKVHIKLQKESMAATNRALRFTNLAFLEDARAFKADAEVLGAVIAQFETEHEEQLALWQEQIDNVRLAA